MWVGDGFVGVAQVAFAAPSNARPYLFAVPPELAGPFGRLLRALGVREAFAPVDFARALSALYGDGARAPLADEQFELALAMLRLVARLSAEEREQARLSRAARDEAGGHARGCRASRASHARAPPEKAPLLFSSRLLAPFSPRDSSAGCSCTRRRTSACCTASRRWSSTTRRGSRRRCTTA